MTEQMMVSDKMYYAVREAVEGAMYIGGDGHKIVHAVLAAVARVNAEKNQEKSIKSNTND